MSGDEITPRDAKDKYSVKTGKPQQFTVRLFKRHLIEVEDLHFHHNSAVFLPDYVQHNTAVEPDRADHLSGLSILALCYRYAGDHAGQKFLIAGHTDTTGDAGYNLELSRLRAGNVFSVLMGKKDDWVKICLTRHKTEDYQQILHWIAYEWSWDCDPGAVTGEDDEQTDLAVKNFKIQFNKDTGSSLKENSDVNRETWEAFYEMYLRGLKKIMKTDDGGLASARGRLTFLDGKHQRVGCGENFPIEQRGVDNYKSATNRRVELLFFDPGEEPKMDCHPLETRCIPSFCQLYNRRFYQPVHIPATPVPPPKPEPGELSIVKVDDHFAPSKESLDFTYKIQKLAAREVKFQVMADFSDYKTKKETLIFERPLTDEEKADGDSQALKKPWQGEINQAPLKDQQAFVNPLMGPFRIRLVSGDTKAEAEFKVLYHSLKMHMGPWTPDEAEPPESSKNDWAQYKLNELGYFGGPVGKDTDSYLHKAVIRYKANHKKFHQLQYSKYTDAITDDLIDVLKKGENARKNFIDPQVLSDSSKTSHLLVEAITYETGEFELAKGKVTKEKERLNRPLIPVEVDITIKRKDGSAESVPEAIGPVRINWSHIDPDEDLSGLDTKKEGEPSFTKDYVELCLKLKGGRSGSNGDNAHKSFAGIRDDAANWPTPFLLGDSYVPYTSADDSANKTVYSAACVDKAKYPKRLGKAGIFFRPSYVGGDDYTIRAEIAFTALPNKDVLEKNHGYTSDPKTRIQVQSGTIWIRRFNAIAVSVTWPPRKNSNQWDEIAGEFGKAYVDIDVKNIAVKKISDAITEAEYRAIVTANTVHKDATKVHLYDDSFVGVDLPAQGTMNAAVYKAKLRDFVYENYWDKVYDPLRKKLSEKLRPDFPAGFIIVDFMTHKPVNIVNDPSPKSATDPTPKDPTVTDKNKNFITWSSSIGLEDSVILADQKDPDKVYYVVSHEMGHNLFLHHWEHAGGMSPAEHDQSDHNCIMSYSSGTDFQAQGVYTPHFCGKCNLKLRGWDVEAAGIPKSTSALKGGPCVEARVVMPDGSINFDPKPKPNDRFRLVVVLTNVGPDQAPGVKAAYKPPAGVTLVNDGKGKPIIRLSQGTYDPTTGVWDAGLIQIEAETWLSFFVQVNAGTSGKKIKHQAEITKSDFKAVVAKDSIDINVQ